MENSVKKVVNKIDISGILLENNLEARVSGNGKEYIGGHLVVGIPSLNSLGEYKLERGEDMSELKVEFLGFRLKKDGTENPYYKSLSTMMEHPSLAQTGDIKQAAFLDIIGSLRENMFLAKDGKLVETVKITAMRCNRTTLEKFKPNVKIELSGCILNMFDEIGQDQIETGRLGIDFATYDTYSATAEKLRFFMDSPAGINYAKGNWNAGDTVKIVASVKRTIEKVEIIEEMGFGENLEKTYEKARVDWTIVSGSHPVEEDNDLYISPEAMQAGLNKRKEKKESIENQAKNTAEAPTANKSFDF